MSFIFGLPWGLAVITAAALVAPLLPRPPVHHPPTYSPDDPIDDYPGSPIAWRVPPPVRMESRL